MTASQAGIFSQQCCEHHIVEYVLNPQAAPTELSAALCEIANLGDNKCLLTLAFGPAIWSRLPQGFAFRAFDMPDIASTQADILVWVQATTRSDVTDALLEAHRRLAGLTTVQLDLPGFTYHDSRDLTGFVDGIGNPRGDAARQAAVVPEGAQGAAGSFVLTQKWVHDLAAFNALNTAEQEAVFGRTKEEAEEFSEERMPPTSHVGRTDHADMKIWRHSVPFANSREQGLYFVAFGRDQQRFSGLLDRMYGRDDAGLVDDLTHFSTPAMSSYWFAPAAAWFAHSCEPADAEPKDESRQ